MLKNNILVCLHNYSVVNNPHISPFLDKVSMPAGDKGIYLMQTVYSHADFAYRRSG